MDGATEGHKGVVRTSAKRIRESTGMSAVGESENLPLKPRRQWNNSWRPVVAVAGGVAVGWILLAVWVRGYTPDVPPPDSAIHEWILQHRTDSTIHIAQISSWFGQTDVALPLIVVAGLAATQSTRRLGRVRAGVLLVSLGGIGVVIGLRLNDFVGRVRPPLADWAGAAGGSSFPSGHTTAATIAAGLVAWTLTRRIADRRGQIATWAAAGIWAGAVGWSRVWLGVHWPTDVICGWLFAASFLILARGIQLKWWPGDAPPAPVVEGA